MSEDFISKNKITQFRNYIFIPIVPLLFIGLTIEKITGTRHFSISCFLYAIFCGYEIYLGLHSKEIYAGGVSFDKVNNQFKYWFILILQTVFSIGFIYLTFQNFKKIY